MSPAQLEGDAQRAHRALKTRARAQARSAFASRQLSGLGDNLYDKRIKRTSSGSFQQNATVHRVRVWSLWRREEWVATGWMKGVLFECKLCVTWHTLCAGGAHQHNRRQDGPHFNGKSIIVVMMKPPLLSLW